MKTEESQGSTRVNPSRRPLERRASQPQADQETKNT